MRVSNSNSSALAQSVSEPQASVRRFVQLVDWKTVEKWCLKRGLPMAAKQNLPEIGLISEIGGRPVAAAWLYRTDSKVVFVDALISDPEVSSEQRQQAIVELLRRAPDFARAAGFSKVVGLAPEVMRNHLRVAGWSSLDATFQLFLKDLE